MTATPEFEKAYKSLNKGQRHAVDTIEGPVMVIAGPGTGKTTVLALRAANILQKTDTPPEGILALTFTDAAVRAMREKLTKFAGAMAASRVEVHTFHSYAERLIARHPEAFPGIIGSRPMGETERLGIIAEIIESRPWQHLKPVGEALFYVRDAAGAISHLKRENQTPEKLNAWLDGEEQAIRNAEENLVTRGANKGKLKATADLALRKIARTRELGELLKLYGEASVAKKVYDFDDILLSAVTALETDELARAEARESALYVMADEHQDANAAQNRMLELLAGDEPSPNLFVVGDEKQSIFRFQGASIENFLFFSARYPGTTLVTLTDTYRSRQPILDAAAEIVGPAPEGSLPRPKLKGRDSDAAAGPEIEVVSHPTRQAEMAWIAREAKKAVDGGIPAGEVAVISRENQELFEIAEWLRAEGLPVSLQAERDIANHPDTRRALAIVRAAVNPDSDEAVAAALSIECIGVHPADLARAIRVAGKSKRSLLDVCRDQVAIKAAGVVGLRKMRSAGETLKLLASLSKSEHVLSFLEAAIYKTGLAYEIAASPEAPDRLPALERIFAEAEAYSLSAGDSSSPAGFLAHIDAAARYGARLSARAPSDSGGVNLLTTHRAKGLEFTRVFVPGLTRDRWEAKRGRRMFHLPAEIDRDEAEARRLLFVAVTRAKDRCQISYAAMREDGRALSPSALVLEISAAQREEPASATAPTRPALVRAARETAAAKKAADESERHVVHELFRAADLSVTALQNYLDCPWKFVYRSLLRLPSARTKLQDLGTAAHAVMREATKSDFVAGMEWAKERLKLELERLPLTLAAREELLAEFVAPLATFVASRRFTLTDRAEVKVSGVSLNVGDWQLPLTGNIDLVSEGPNGTLSVLDYKLSRPRSPAVVRGEAKGSDGRYLRQLRFYKLLLDRSSAGKGSRVTRGAIAFMRPNQSGKFGEVPLDLGPADSAAIEAEILSAAKEIDTLAFWDRRCDDRKCLYCYIRELKAEN